MAGYADHEHEEYSRMPLQGQSGFGAMLRRMPGTQEVTIVHDEGQANETRTTAQCNVQSTKGFFEVDTPIYEGDVIELPDPRGGLRRLTVRTVEIADEGRGSALSHLAAVWGTPNEVRRPAISRVSIEDLHPAIVRVAGGLYVDGHYSSAIFEAFKAVEVKVRELSGLRDSGLSLMAKAFDERNPLIDMSIEAGRSGQDEQLGFKFLFMGAVAGIRNPKSHELVRQDNAQRVIEYLAFASILMRRLDDSASRPQAAQNDTD